MFLRLQLLVLYLVKIQSSSSIVNSKGASRFHYLNQQHPLWVLEDQVSSMERDIAHITFTTTAKPHYPTYYFKYRRQIPIPLSSYYRATPATSPTHIDLPKRYIYADQNNYSRYSYDEPARAHKFWRRQQPVSIPLSSEFHTPSMPTFDSVPNDIDAADDVLAPIFVYNGPKGELIMNTMLSAQKYPMQEPVPGQILYPPTAPIFRPKPIVQRFRVPGRTESMNLTLIPFYAHEAIVPRFLYASTKNSADSTEAADTTLATSTLPTAVFYAAPAPTRSTITTTSTTAATTLKPTKKRRHKKVKHYAVYRSPDEVHWRPTEAALSRISSVTTPYPMVLDNPLQNHRYSDDIYDATTTLKPPTNFKLTYKDEDSHFQIVYVDESLEKPISQEAIPTRSPVKHSRLSSTPKPVPLLSSHYSADKEYYAFPVYTLGKLLKPDTSEKSLPYSSYFPSYKNQKTKSDDSVDTWFIMNSRYKGHRNRDGSNRLSSKYLEVPPATKKLLSTEIAETTLENNVL